MKARIDELVESTAKSFEEFDKWLEGRGLSIEKTVDGWGQPRYLHPHIQSMFDGWNASRAALLADTDVAGMVEELRLQDENWPRALVELERRAASCIESLAAQNAALAAQVAERDAEIARLKMENSKLRSALEIVHFKREPWQ